MKISASSYALAVGLLLGVGTVALGGSDDCSECRTLRDEVERLKDQVSDLKRDVDTLQRDARSGRPQKIVLHATHSLTYTGGMQHCDSDEVVTSYTHREGEARIEGDCAELHLE